MGESIEIDGRLLRRHRRRLRLSVADLAEKIDRNPQTLYRLEQGKGNTSMALLDDLCDLIGRDVVASLVVSDEDREDFLAGVDLPSQ